MTDESGKPSPVPLKHIYRAIVDAPGINRTDLAKEVGVPRGSLEGRLASLESQKLYITEDHYGRLYVHEN